MSHTVYKYLLSETDWCTLSMPLGAEPLCVQVQDGSPYLWARVDRDEPMVSHSFRIAGTGHDLGPGVGKYIGTFQLYDGALVFHVFAEGGAA